MAEWLVLALLVPAIVVPVVLLFGFAGCDQVFGLDRLDAPQPAPIIESATGKSLSTITLTWAIDQTATSIEFERTRVDAPGELYKFTVPASPPSHDDSAGLNPATTYEYTARAVFADGDRSEASAPVRASTLTPPAFDAVGAGNTGAGTANVTTTWSHTASGDSSAVVVGLRWSHTGGFFPPSGTPTRTATYGGTLMTSLGVVGLNNAALTDINGTFVYHEFFGLLSPPTGEQPVSISVARPGAGSITVEGCSASYSAVSAFGSISANFGTEPGTSLSQNVISAMSERVVQMFTTASGPITNYNQTLRFGGVANGIGFVIGDAPGAASVPFTATRADSVDYAGLAVRLTPIS
ncbi:fibronectin type III domain-containing protein [Mycolicibacterium celeriflavum]|uniref:Uncharacterized protein n=1 Tax=Mycolicibacterium celeriflavum TaxID=1249101 RepID=A0A1X0BWE7_MYCCF|nr:hypothetical protein [Mycolicibacterium celeriflavum]MCV7240718.1 hypothetical protein [Mycolicibacterium celeriflavum]ORA48184.1 hypothetical protein BST21_11310 [Mycolicibacterium celeriflavum]BBY43568.1 hypothetical protein MCEL_18630 [Mycolicibacterium celeriflavum]